MGREDERRSRHGGWRGAAHHLRSERHRQSVPGVLSRGGAVMVDTVSRVRQGPVSSEAREHSEGTVARAIEQQTARLPSDLFLWAALASIGGSLILQASGK